jgi:hypothetical protein
VEAPPLTPNNIELSSGSNATFNAPAQSMTLGLQGSSASTAAVKGSDMLYGQVEVTAMVNAAMDGFSTAFYLQGSGGGGSSSSSSVSSGQAASRGEDCILFQFLTGGSPPVPNSVVMSSSTRCAMS